MNCRKIEEQLNSENFSLQRAALNTLEILGPILSSKDITILGSVVKKVGTPQFIFTALSILESFIPILERESLQGLLLAIVSKIKGYYDPFSDDFLQLLKCNPTPSKEQAQLFIIKLTAAIARQGDTNNTGFGDLAVNFIGLQVVDHTLLKEVSWVDSSFFEIMTTWLKQLAMLDLPKKSSAHHSFFRAPPLTEKRGDLLENEVESNHLSK